MDVKEKDFFIASNTVHGVTEDDYRRAELLVGAARAFARSSYQCVYVIDYFREGFLYVSENLSYLCGEPTEAIMSFGYSLYIKHVPEEEQKILLEVNHAGFSFFSRLPVTERMDYSISYDFHITNGRKRRLINHKLTPLMLTSDGKMWLALCTMSVSSRRTPGHVVIKKNGSSIFHEYSLEKHCWNEKQEEMLSDTERTVLILSAQGFTMQEIAENLCKSVDTIKSCKRKLFSRIGVGSISEAIAYAANNRLI